MAQLSLFDGDIPKLVGMVFNPNWSNEDTFLRELVLNASDALCRIKQGSDPGEAAAHPELFIRIVPDKENRTLTIEDNGIGMTSAELAFTLGAVARSDSKHFLELTDGPNRRFGIGFYSVFVVSDKVCVISKNNFDEQHIWESDGRATFSVRKDEEMLHGEIKRGTKVMCHLKADQAEFLEETRLVALVRKYSEWVQFPRQLDNRGGACL